MIPDRAQFRDPARYIAAVASELASPLLRAYSAARARGSGAPPVGWRRGLIMGSGHIGDVLYRTCSLEHLSRDLPLCRWSYLTTRDGAEVLRDSPTIAEVLPFSRETAADFLPPHSAAELRARNFDVVLCTDNIQHHRPLWLAAKLGIPNRVAFVQKGFSGLATFPVRTGRAAWPAQIRAMFEAVTGTSDTSELRPRVYLSAAERRTSLREWNCMALGDAALTIAVSLTSRQQLGVFPESLFVSILRAILQQSPDSRVVLTGTQSERAALETVASQIGPRAVVTAGKLSLREFAAFLALCDAFIGADSGPRHLANAAAVPVFFVRNLAVPEVEAGKYCDSETDIAPPGQYLSRAAAIRRLHDVDYEAVASAVIAAARRHRTSANPNASRP